MQTGFGGRKGEFAGLVGRLGGLPDDAVVVIEGLLDGDLDGEVGGDVEGVRVGVVGFGFVCS